jgi:hypothetical protein
MLAGADAPGDGLADLSCSDYDDDFFHDGSCGCVSQLYAGSYQLNRWLYIA